MAVAPRLSDRIEAIVASRAPRAWRDRSGNDVSLGREGLNLDSITIVEILVECEAVLGVPFPPTIVDGRPLTITRLAAHARAAGAHPAS